MTTTRSALSSLITLHPHINYSVTEDLRYKHGKLSGQHIQDSWYYIHVHYGDDGVGMTEKETFDGENLDTVLALATEFVKTLLK